MSHIMQPIVRDVTCSMQASAHKLKEPGSRLVLFKLCMLEAVYAVSGYILNK